MIRGCFAGLGHIAEPTCFMAAMESLSVPATSDGVRDAADAFEAFAASQGVAPAVRWRFLVALDEALSNIVRHGYGGAVGEMHLEFRLSERRLSVTVEDSAPMFNPLLVAPPVLERSPDRGRPGGLGIALVRALMDEVSYRWRDQRNCLVMVRSVD